MGKTINQEFFKFLSILMSAYNLYFLGETISGTSEYTLEAQIGFPLVGSIVIYMYMSQIIDAYKARGSNVFILYSLPFVINWMLIVPSLYGKVLDIYVDNTYTQKVSIADTYENNKAKLSLLKDKENISIAKQEQNFKPTVTVIDKPLSFYISKVSRERSSWISNGKPRNSAISDYWSHVVSYLSVHDKIKSGAKAIAQIAKYLKDTDTNSISEQSTFCAVQDKTLSSEISMLSEKVARAKRYHEDILAIEAQSPITETRLYIIMALFGFAFEIFITHYEYFLSEKAIGVITQNTNELEVNYKSNALLACIQCIKNNENPSKRNINKFSSMINPKTGKKYNTDKYGLMALEIITAYKVIGRNGNVDLIKLQDAYDYFKKVKTN